MQTLPVNVAVPVCVALSCDTGSVEQSNTNSSGDASAGNTNTSASRTSSPRQGVGGDATTGDATTGGSGDAYGGDVTQSQTASNSNETTQDASAESKAYQTVPVNVYVPVCVAYRCDTGDVSQSNSNTSSDASAGNVNKTGQSNEQSQQGYGGDASTGDATTGGLLWLGRCNEWQRIRRRRDAVTGRLKLEQHVADRDGASRRRPRRSRQRVCAGLHREVLQDG